MYICSNELCNKSSVSSQTCQCLIFWSVEVGCKYLVTEHCSGLLTVSEVGSFSPPMKQDLVLAVCPNRKEIITCFSSACSNMLVGLFMLITGKSGCAERCGVLCLCRAQTQWQLFSPHCSTSSESEVAALSHSSRSMNLVPLNQSVIVWRLTPVHCVHETVRLSSPCP